MLTVKIGVVIPARNEEKRLPLTLKALLNQTVKPYKTIVIDDGSTDRTREIALEHGVDVISLPDRGYRAGGMPVLATTINKGLEALSKENLDYVMILGADHILFKDYIEKIVNRMKNPRIVVAGGVILGDRYKARMPRGSGRLINAKWFHKIGFKYPPWWGFEAWLLFKAESMGYNYTVVKEAKSVVQRKTGVNPAQMYGWGKGMNALCYHPAYRIGRVIYSLRHGVKGAAYMLQGSLIERTSKYTDICSYVKRITAKRIIEIIT